MKNALLYLWQLPQNLLGLILRAIYKGNDGTYESATVRRSLTMKGGISLGRYIIVNQFSTRTTIAHEYGHCRQSLCLGWLYLIVIGLPSILHCWLCKCRKHDYADFYTEKWADRLGNVKR